MRRPRLAVIAIVVSIWCRAAGAQTAALPEGWVVLPVDAALTRVDYDLRVDADSVTGRALLTVDVMREGWARVQIPAGLMVREASLEGRRVSLVDGTPPSVLLSRPGRSVLTLDVVIPMTAAGGAESIVLPPSPSPISCTRLTLPGNGVDLTSSGRCLPRSERPPST